MHLEAASTISMDAHKNPNLETTHHCRIHTTPSTSSQDFKRTHQEFFANNLNKPSDNHAAREGDHHKAEESGRERLKRHRVEMSGRVWIPDTWGQEDLLKNWIDCTVFDSALAKSSIMSAREALIQEAGRSTLRIDNSCCACSSG